MPQAQGRADPSLCAVCAGKNRWYPTSIADLDAFLGPHIRKSVQVPNGYAVRKNVCYGIQYLQYLSSSLEQLSLSEVLIAMTYKQFIVNGIGVVEGLLFYLIKARGLHRTAEWELMDEHSAPPKAIGADTFRTETRLLRKRVSPIDEALTLERILRIAERQKVLGSDSAFYAQIHHLRNLRNKIHLHITRHDLDSDFNAFELKDFELMKRVLLLLLSGQPFAPSAIQGSYLTFLAPWRKVGVSYQSIERI